MPNLVAHRDSPCERLFLSIQPRFVMKKIILLSGLILAGMFHLQAQITIEPETLDASFTSADLTNNWLDLETHVSVTNTSNETIEIKWEREIPANCPDTWETQVCDNNLCYGFATSTNYEEGGIMSPFVLDPGETFSIFAFHIWPHMTAGCCQPKIHFSLIDDPTNILATLTVNASVNDASCFGTPTEETSLLNGVALFPNPSFGQFTLTNNEVIKHLTIYNILGKQMKQVNYSNGDYVDVSELANGLYLVALQNKNGQTLKTLRLAKRSFQP